MVQPKSKKSVGLGNTLMNDRFGKGKGADRKKATAIARVNHNTGEEYLTNEKKEASWVKMRSVTEQGALDEFLSTAELAGTDFTAEKMNNIKIIHTDQKNPYLLSAAEERAVAGKHRAHKGRLTVPRRPEWDASTSPEQLDVLERESFINWRRGLAELQENNDLLMTPFERNIEVWRQLWRVIERSDLVVQIVDARNPLLFRSEDLGDYVKAVDPKKENLLLINKADMMTYSQRLAWARYLKGAGIAYKFFSASLAKELLDAEEEDDHDTPSAPAQPGSSQTRPEGVSSDEEEEDESEGEGSADDDDVEDKKKSPEAPSSQVEVTEDDTQILTVEELEEIFLSHAPKDAGEDHKLQVGLVGYPNVGKSSTINALIGAKKVSVSATPGKTKHFQTIHLSEKVLLCDCPGLVFPNFANTKADLVCNGVLPIDQLREYTGPAGLVARRIPKHFLEAIYGIHIPIRPLEEGGTGTPTAEELLRAYAKARGFQTQGLGQPDESRAARYILKDYVSGKLLYCEPPPGDIDPDKFNAELYDELHVPEKRRAALAASLATLSLAADEASTTTSDFVPLPAGPKSKRLDRGFFAAAGTSTGHMKMPFSHKYTQQGQDPEKQLSGRKRRELIAIQNGMDPKDVQLTAGKKHFKAGPRNGKGKKHRNKLDDDE
ncbi:putative ribosome biogenesis GTPase Lsg1 [Sodiomyces alkalinus F11]|uniref:Putative ribosome biogenesis GTPase Lsg1 n=1 Tax=Sodiomyces alkalinus (strain CBS 110278 / VKM F-3762 / F11) TaxID=1314773 RepID=A0A3N2PXE2_SODAK|nr:putative ribosome biogenesis GTPase Lsg1 [Sodiomyces alkalinus F11]ROT39200.1 putative ribosome biogenesis GTPase Lsg1 [Sodiomyces alkalinus F11]